MYNRGIITGLGEAFEIDRENRDRLIQEDKKSEEIIKPFPKKKSPELEELSEKMISLNRRLAEIGDKCIDERVRLEDENMKTDNEINQSVYELYGLTDADKKIIESCLQ